MLEINECAAATGEDAIYPGASALQAGHSFSDLDGKHGNKTNVRDTGNINDDGSTSNSDGEGCEGLMKTAVLMIKCVACHSRLM